MSDDAEKNAPSELEPDIEEAGEEESGTGYQRWSISKEVKNLLESVYRADQFPSTEIRKQLAAELGDI